MTETYVWFYCVPRLYGRDIIETMTSTL